MTTPDHRRSGRTRRAASVAFTLTLLLGALGSRVSAAAPGDAPAGATQSGAPQSVTPPAHATQITIRNFMFSPATLSIKAGATVTWVNQDQEPHTVVSNAGVFRSGALDTHESFVFRFDEPGTYHFICTIHPQMLGTIVVE